MFLTTATKAIFNLLANYQFWSKLGFFISYLATCLIVLEVLRLVYSDASKRDIEKMLDSYTRSRVRETSDEDVRQEKAVTMGGEMKVTLEELKREIHAPSPRRRRSSAATRAVTPESDRTLVDASASRRRSSRTVSAERIQQQHAAAVLAQQQHAAAVLAQQYPHYAQQYAHHQAQHHSSQSQPQSQSPPRRLRKRSDTLTSAGSAESKSSGRRRREGSPASVAGSSKSSSRHASPTRRSKEERERKAASGLGRMLKPRA